MSQEGRARPEPSDGGSQGPGHGTAGAPAPGSVRPAAGGATNQAPAAPKLVVRKLPPVPTFAAAFPSDVPVSSAAAGGRANGTDSGVKGKSDAIALLLDEYDDD